MRPSKLGQSTRRNHDADRRPTMPAGLKGLADGPRVRSLPFAFFTKRYRPAVLHTAAYLDAMGAVGDTCRWDHPGTIASAIGFKERAVELALKTIADDGWIRIERGRVGNQETNVYWLLWRFATEDTQTRADERPATKPPAVKTPAVRAASARTCAPACAPPSVDRGLSPSASAPASAEPCAAPAHACAPPSLLESSIQVENITPTLRDVDFQLPDANPATPQPTEAEIAEARRHLANRNPMLRRAGANALAAWGLCPAEFLGLVNKEAHNETKPPVKPKPTPTSTVEMIVALADPTSSVAVELVADRMTRELDDWNSKPWMRKILGEVKTGMMSGADLAKCYTEAKRQTKIPAKVYFGRGVKSLRAATPSL